MTDFEIVANLLREIRDLQKVQIEFAKSQSDLVREEVARSIANQERSLENQQVALNRQRSTNRLYRVLLAIAVTALVMSLLAIKH